MKGFAAFSKTSVLLEPHHQIVYCHIQDTRCGGVLPCIREAVGVFYSPSQLGNMVRRNGKSTLGHVLCFLLVILCQNFWLSLAICLYLKSSENIMRLIISDRFWFMQTIVIIIIIIILTCHQHGYSNPLSPPLPIVHRFRQVFRATPRI